MILIDVLANWGNGEGNAEGGELNSLLGRVGAAIFVPYFRSRERAFWNQT